MSKLRIKKGDLVTLNTWLANIPLSAQESRARTKFISAFQDQIKDVENARIELVERLAEKDADGKPVMVESEEGMKYDLTEEANDTFKREFAELLDEVIEATVSDETHKFSIVRHIVLNTNMPFQGPQATMYAAWCDALEAVS